MIFINPTTTTRISDGWDAHRARASLGGIDHPVPIGTPVYAVAAGTVVVADTSPSGSGGRYISIYQGNGLRTEYLHLSKLNVQRGQQVTQGQTIALSGASAYGSETGTDGAHLHWHAVLNGVRVNPLNYVTDKLGDEDMGLTLEDKEWLRLCVRQEIEANKSWTREMVRQEVLEVLGKVRALFSAVLVPGQPFSWSAALLNEYRADKAEKKRLANEAKQ